MVRISSLVSSEGNPAPGRRITTVATSLGCVFGSVPQHLPFEEDNAILVAFGIPACPDSSPSSAQGGGALMRAPGTTSPKRLKISYRDKIKLAAHDRWYALAGCLEHHLALFVIHNEIGYIYSYLELLKNLGTQD